MPHIAKLVPRRNHTWVEITTSCGQSIKLPLDEVPHTIVAGLEIEEHTWQMLCNKSEYSLLYEKAVRSLGRREHFASELSRKLRQKSVDRELVERVVNECVKRGYLDEKRATQQLVEKLANRGGVGIQRVKAELFRSGCPKELMSWAMELAADLIDEQPVLERLLQSRKKTFQSKLDKLRRAKQDGLTPPQVERQIRQKLGASVTGFLLGRGFHSDHCRNKVRELVDELMGEA